MEENYPDLRQQIPQEDWDRTPASVKKLVVEMRQGIEKLEEQVAELRTTQQQLLERINRTSKNSSSPPSQDPPNAPKQKQKGKSGKKRGGQKGHDGHSRPLYPAEQCESIIDHHPTSCACCGEKLSGEDINPYRHQIVEIPPIAPIVIEHRLHQLVCSKCGAGTRATLPIEVNPSGYGASVVAMVAVLSGLYRHSQRMVQSALADLFGITMSLGSINSLRLEASDAVASVVEEAKKYIQQQPVVGADETSFDQGNIDGCNPKQRQAWLWVAVTPLVTFFEIALSRCTEAARNLLGENFGGILTSDRHGAYNWVDLERRQLCWAHLRREFIKISERPGVSKELGTALVKQLELLFELWHRVRDGTLARCDACGVSQRYPHPNQGFVTRSRRL